MSHRVLVVEDDHDIRDLMVAALEASGYVAIAASDGKDGLDKLTTSNPQPSVILLDMMMPAMDGQTFRKLQRQDAAIAHIAVVVISAHPDLPRIAKEMGVVTYLQKPADISEMLRIVGEHCQALDARPHPVIVVDVASALAGDALASDALASADAAAAPDEKEPS